MYDLNTAPDWLLTESAQMLGKIHTVLRDYQAVTSGNCCADRVCNHRDHSWYRDLEISAAGIYKSLSGGIAYENGKMYQRILFRDR